MKTQVIMKRKLFNDEISQQSKTGFLSLTDLERVGNKWRIENNLPLFKKESWLRNLNTKEFIENLRCRFGVIKINAKGRNQHTWVHPFLFIDMALAISPELKIEVYSWLYDNLIKYRNDSGDSYKKMTGSMFLVINNKSNFKQTLIETAKKIKSELNVDNWQTAGEEKLNLRNKIHDNISLLCDVLNNVEDAVRIGIKKTIDMENIRELK